MNKCKPVEQVASGSCIQISGEVVAGEVEGETGKNVNLRWYEM